MLKSYPNAAKFRRVATVFVSTALILFSLDYLLGRALYSLQNRNAGLQSLARYFDYGRSIEGKLEKTIGLKHNQTDQVVKAGWLSTKDWSDRPSQPAQSGGKIVAVYGQSFAFNASREMQRQLPGITLRLIGGPAAPLSHSYAAFEADQPLRGKVDAVIVGVLASSISKMGKISMVSSTFESPAPFTFPSYSLDRHGAIQHEQPLITSSEVMIDAFQQRSPLWTKFVAQIRAHSPEMDRFTTEANILDTSILVRMIRRGWVNSRAQDAEGPVDPFGRSAGFDSQMPIARALIEDMARKTNARGELLIVILLNDRGYDRALGVDFQDAIEPYGITVVNTSNLFSSKDPTSFIPDGHYSEEANHKIGSALVKALTQTPISKR
jgi:hypothetical protein